MSQLIYLKHQTCVHKLCSHSLIHTHTYIKKKKKQTSAPQLNGNVGITVDM